MEGAFRFVVTCLAASLFVAVIGGYASFIYSRVRLCLFYMVVGLFASQRGSCLVKYRPRQGLANYVLGGRYRGTFRQSREDAVGRRQAVFLVVESRVFRFGALQRIVVCLSYSRLPAAASNVFRRGIGLEAVRDDLSVFCFDLRAFFFANFGSNLLYLFPVLVAASVFLAVGLVAREGLDLGIDGIRQARRGKSGVRCTGRFALRLVQATRGIHVVLYRAACADRAIGLAALFMATCHAGLYGAREGIFMQAQRVLVGLTVVQAIR